MNTTPHYCDSGSSRIATAGPIHCGDASSRKVLKIDALVQSLNVSRRLVRIRETMLRVYSFSDPHCETLQRLCTVTLNVRATGLKVHEAQLRVYQTHILTRGQDLVKTSLDCH